LLQQKKKKKITMPPKKKATAPEDDDVLPQTPARRARSLSGTVTPAIARTLVAIADRGATPASGQASPRAESPEAEEPVDEAQAEAEGQKLRDIVSANSQHLELLDLKVVRYVQRPVTVRRSMHRASRALKRC
jgi:hypothetical protein